MSEMLIEEYSRAAGAAPHLFSQTRGFRFLGKGGRLGHRSLPPGPKGYRVVSVVSTGHEASFFEESRVALTIPLSGAAEVSAEGGKSVVRPGDAFVIAPSNRHSRLMPAQNGDPYRSFTIIGPPQVTAEYVASSCWVHRQNYRSQPQLQDVLRFAFGIAQRWPGVSGTSAAAMEAMVEELFLAAIAPQAGGQKPDAVCRPRLVARAEDLMRERFSQPLTVRDLADTLNVRSRTLQSAFRRHHGQTPWSFLNHLRIDEMRRRLLNPEADTTVTSAALDAGLFHLGRCSQAYTRRYGELPSQTLRRARLDG